MNRQERIARREKRVAQRGFLENIMMHPDWDRFENAFDTLQHIWNQWEAAPGTQPGTLAEAKRELKDYLMRKADEVLI